MGAPSGGNLQPWKAYVVAGEKRDEICDKVRALNEEGTMTQGTEYHVYPPKLSDPYKQRRKVCGHQLYSTIGVDRKDMKGKVAHLARNWQLFDAPVCIFFSIDRQMQEGQWADLGMYIQTIMLLCEER